MPKEKSTAGTGATKSAGHQTVESLSGVKRHVAETQDNSTQQEEDQPSPPKRQRVSRACDQCRNKKDRCDGVQPTCSTCTFLKRSCSYKSNPKKRGLPTGYIRTLELLWGAAFTLVPGSEDTVRNFLRTSSIQGHMAAMIKEGDSSDTFLSGWKNSMALKEMERLLTALEQSDGDPGIVDLDDDSEVGHRAIDRAAEFSELKTTYWQIPEDADFSNGSPSIPLTERTYANRPQYHDIGSQTPTERSLKGPETTDPPSISSSMNDFDLRLQLPSHAWRLFDIYFAYTHCSLPIVEKHDILRTAFYYNENPLRISCNTQGSGSHASLWAILTLASLQNQYASSNAESGDRQDSRSSDKLYDIARRLIPSENGNFELGHIQALLILSLVKIGHHEWAAASMLVGHAIRMSYAIGIDKRVSIKPEKSNAGNGRGRQTHVFLGCFVLDTMIASQMKRLPELPKEQITEIGFLLEDGLEEWQPWEEPSGFRLSTRVPSSSRPGPALALSTFNRLVSLSCFLNDILHWKHDQENASSQLQLIGRDMDRWLEELSRTCQVNFQEAATPLPPHVLAVHIAYESVFAAFLLHSSQYYPVKRVLIRPRYTAILRLYMETYGSAATSPLFTVFLNLACSSQSSHDSATTLYPDLQTHPEIDTVSSQLRHIWAGQRQQESVIDLDSNPYQTQTRAPHTRSGNHIAYQSNAEFGARSNPNSSDPWSRIVDHRPQSSSLETPCPSLIPESYTSQETIRWPHMAASIEDHLRSADLPTSGNSSSMMASSSSFPLRDSDSRYRPPLPSSDNNINTFGTELNDYGPEQPRIAPDLDTLFDELASLDGGEK